MKRIKEQIEACLQLAVTGDGQPMAGFRFPADFVGFQGHFPGKSILPGACQLQCLLSLLERVCGKELALKEIVLAKYISPVLPGQEVSCILTETPDFSAGGLTVRAFIFRGGEKVTELRVRVSTRETAQA